MVGRQVPRRPIWNSAAKVLPGLEPCHLSRLILTTPPLVARIEREMEIRFYEDPETGLPHIYQHGITEAEVWQVLHGRGENLRGRDDSLIRVGRTAAGRYLQVIYVPDEDPESVFVITAYEVRGKAKTAFRRRQRRKAR